MAEFAAGMIGGLLPTWIIYKLVMRFVERNLAVSVTAFVVVIAAGSMMGYVRAAATFFPGLLFWAIYYQRGAAVSGSGVSSGSSSKAPGLR